MPPAEQRDRVTLRGGLAALLLFAALAVLHTWPLATAPGSLSRHDNGDALLNEWVIAWVQHQVFDDPRDLFDANIFHPEKRTLAFAEHLFTQSMLGLPFHLAGASTTVVFNLVLLLAYALTGWTTCLVVRHVTGDWAAGVLAGMLMAFNAYSMTHLPHMQTLHLEFLAPALLALDRLMRRPGLLAAVVLALAVALQALTSNYFMVSLAFAMLAAAVVRPADWRTSGRPLVLYSAVAAAAAGMLLLPFVLPYVEMRAAQGFRRGLDPALSATWRDYLITGSRLHFEWWSRAFWGQGSPLFPGVTAAALALAAIGSGLAWRNRFARMWLGVGVLLGLLSLGSHLPGYAWLHEHFTPLQGIRTPARFGQFGLASVAVLAGFGLAWLRARIPGRRWRRAAGAAALALVTIESARAPMGFVAALTIPGAYDVLRTERRAVVAEFPFFASRAYFHNAPYMLASTRHWRPLVNGYSGLVPGRYRQVEGLLAGFPDETSLRALRDLGVTHVVVHHDPLAPTQWGFGPLLDPPAALQPVAQPGPLTIYRLRWERVPDEGSGARF